jgi:exodeoxyribonuclease-3
LTIKLLSYNIRFGGIGREAWLAQVIRAVDPDIVVLQEATNPQVVEELAKATQLPVWAARPGHSIAYITRLEIREHTWHRPPGSKHAFLEIAPAGSESRIFGLHLSAIFSRWSESRRAREIRALLQGIEQHKEGFHLLVGDFNALAPGERLNVSRMPGWIQALIWISGRDIQRETIQIMLAANYVDGYRYLHPEDKGYTFPTWDPHLRLDYVFVPALHAERLLHCEVGHEVADVERASDHYPLLAHLDLR